MASRGFVVGAVLWWQEAGAYVALSGPSLTKEDLVWIAASMSFKANLAQTPQPVKSEQSAIDRLFQVWGSEADFKPFPRTIGIREEVLVVGGPTLGKLPATFETSASAAGQGNYEVKLIRRWKLNDKNSQTTWTLQVQPGAVEASGLLAFHPTCPRGVLCLPTCFCGR
jgi:hypothetical protein